MADIGIITFQLENMHFCVYAEHILEIVKYSGVQKIPKPLSYVVGLVELRRHVVTVVDLHKRFGLSRLVQSKDTVMIVATLPSGTFGILVDAISDFRRIPETMILPPISVAGFPEHLLKGVLAEKDDIMLIPNFDKIFSSYINIHLVPMSSSEKIAFQYRFTPGALSQTLENNLLRQQYLGDEMIKKLPRALCLSSVLIHRMVSYYKDFSPQKESQARQISQDGRKKTKAADEKYLALSQQVHSEQKTLHKIKPEDSKRNQQDPVSSILAHPESSAFISLEKILHALGRSKELTLMVRTRQHQTLKLQVREGRLLARTLHLPPVKVNKYFTYYTQAASQQSMTYEVELTQGLTSSCSSPEQRLEAVLNKEHVPEGDEKTLVPALLPILQTIQREYHKLTREQIATLCEHYQVSPVKIAQLASFFPEYRIAMKHTPAVDEQEAEDRTQGKNKKKNERTAYMSDLTLTFEPTCLSIGECLWNLADQKILSDKRYVRHVASQLRIPTCRLSKLQRYYRWNNEQTD